MIVYPAVDILSGKCVRLYQGQRDKVQVFFENPVDAAKMWEQKGARALHIVDLDGAFEGVQRNLCIIEKIMGAISIPVQVGGGIRNMEAINNLLSCGVQIPILGTSAVFNGMFLKSAIDKCGDDLIVSIDAKAGKVTTKGWVATEALDALDFAMELKALGVKNTVYTDISKDGTLEGVNLEELKKVCTIDGLNVIASGGINSLENIKLAKELGAKGVISGLALYNGVINLVEANRI